MSIQRRSAAYYANRGMSRNQKEDLFTDVDMSNLKSRIQSELISEFQGKDLQSLIKSIDPNSTLGIRPLHAIAQLQSEGYLEPYGDLLRLGKRYYNENHLPNLNNVPE